MTHPIHEVFVYYTKNRDERSFRKLFDHFYPRLFQFSLRFTGQPVLAEEAVSEVFYKLLRDKKSHKDIKNITYFLFKAVKNQCISILRRARRDRVVESIVHEDDYLIPTGSNPENRLLSNEVQQILQDAVKRLPARRQMIFRLVREEGLKHKEVADILEISPRTVETHLGLAIKDLMFALRGHLHGRKLTSISNSN